MNAIRRSLERDEPVYGVAAVACSPTMIETLGGLGLDYVWVDLEHAGPSPDDSTVLEELTRAAEVADVEVLVRISSPDPHVVRKVLDAGVRTILVPRIEAPDEIRRAVAAAHFEYDGDVGERGIGVGRANKWGAARDGYIDNEDEDVLVGAMIENTRAVENLSEILDVPQLGFAFVGPSDLSVSLGHPLATEHPAVQDAIDRTLDACLDAGVPLGCIRNDPERALEAVEDGYRLIRVGSDLGALRLELSSRLEALKD